MRERCGYSEGVNSVTSSIRWCLLLAFIGPGISAGQTLSTSEQNQAAQLANGLAWSFNVHNRTGTPGPAPNPSQKPSHEPTHEPTHELGQQILSIEPDITKNTTQHNRVRVYQFNYDWQAARVVMVSLSDNAVIREQAIASVHLPLNTPESDAALTVLSADDNAITELQADQQRRGRMPFTHIQELSMKASIYKPIDQSHACAQERCALLSLFDSDNTVFSAEPIVNLQQGKVSWLNR